jgi:hypothetical protein
MLYVLLSEPADDKGYFDDAITHYEKAIQLDPNFATAYNNLGNVYVEKNQTEKAINFFQKALEIVPDFAEACNNLGKALFEIGVPEEAVRYCRRAIQIKPNYAEAYNNLGIIVGASWQIEEAITYFQKAIEIKNDFDDAHLNLSFALLRAGNLKAGWREYEHRLRMKDYISRRNHVSALTWEGSLLKGKTLFIYAEQGIGDEIMFASCLPDVIDQAALCIVECEQRLVPLFSRSFPNAMVVQRIASNNYPMNLPKTDFKIALGSLPKIFRQTLLSFPQRKAYLIPDNQLVNMWHDRYKKCGESFKVGISWRGGREPRVIRERSIALEKWAELFSISRVNFINLQYGDCFTELRDIQKNMNITIYDWDDADPPKDLDNFSAQISALDLVISIDNSTVHMAGAVGKSVWTLLPFNSEWRWMLNREDSPWYPTMRLFRQPTPGYWEPVIVTIKDKLLKQLNKN